MSANITKAPARTSSLTVDSPITWRPRDQACRRGQNKGGLGLFVRASLALLRLVAHRFSTNKGAGRRMVVQDTIVPECGLDS